MSLQILHIANSRNSRNYILKHLSVAYKNGGFSLSARFILCVYTLY